jgi:hypothetical protein
MNFVVSPAGRIFKELQGLVHGLAAGGLLPPVQLLMSAGLDTEALVLFALRDTETAAPAPARTKSAGCALRSKNSGGAGDEGPTACGREATRVLGSLAVLLLELLEVAVDHTSGSASLAVPAIVAFFVAMVFFEQRVEGSREHVSLREEPTDQPRSLIQIQPGGVGLEFAGLREVAGDALEVVAHRVPFFFVFAQRAQAALRALSRRCSAVSR